MKNIGLALLAFAIIILGSCGQVADIPFRLRQSTGISFSNDLHPTDSFNIIQYLYYYNGGGVAAGDINRDGLPDLYFTANEGPNQLYLNRGNFQFEEISGSAGVSSNGEWSTGVTMADVDGDGRLDIYVCQLGDYKGKSGRNRLYINETTPDGEVHFREAAAEYGLDFRGFATQASFFDYDLDGDLDVYLLNHSVHGVGNYGKAVSLRPQKDELAGDRLLRNDQIPPPGAAPGGFVDVTDAAGIFSSRIGYGLGIATGDLNNDGWPDIYVSNDFHENDYLYFNNGDGTFSENIEGSMSCTSQFSMGNAISDWNNDNWPDIISLDMKPEEETLVKSTVGADPYNIFLLKRSFGYYNQFPKNMLQINRGNGADEQPVFSDVSQFSGVEATDWSWAPLVTDLDNDGWKDIYITNGIWQRPNDLDYLIYLSSKQVQQMASDRELASKMPSGKASNYAFRNRGDLTFEDVSAKWGLDLFGVSNGAVYADLDGDGDQDIVINNLNAPASVYENEIGSTNNYLKVELEGSNLNPFGIGARVTITIDGKTQIQEMYTTRGFLSSVEPVLYFGLGKAHTVDRLEVNWPGGQHTVLETIPANETLKVRQDETTSGHPSSLVSEKYIDPVTADQFGLSFTHQEDQFVDFEQEPLIPNLLSTQGPHMAVGDVNADGLDDLFIGGARGQSDVLFYQRENGHFERAVGLFPENVSSEAVDAVFFDCDQDGDQDLLIINGGGAYKEGHPGLLDRLYINDGLGNFTLNPDALPTVARNGSCVVPLDFNRDGALDLFIGVRSVPGIYGIDPQSMLLENSGDGHFRDVTEQFLPEQGRLGMVTDAAVLEGDGDRKLVVVGEWMPVQLLTIGSNVWQTHELPGSSGWWNRVVLADCNQDGQQDLILGNWGLNTNLHASPEEPMGLYVKDFDGNRKLDPVVTHFRQGKEYPLVSIDEMTKQMPEFRKLLRTYTAFSQLGFEDVFTPGIRAGAVEKKVVCLSSSIALSDGRGNYRLQPLPNAAQLSAIFGILAEDLNGDGNTDLLLAGNFNGSTPALGMNDASLGILLLGDGTGHFRDAGLNRSYWRITGETRDLQLLQLPQQKLVVAARNALGLWVGRLEEVE
ncbi:MAG: VCBS repeat-containing protein [Saprospiraceae bacterium]